MAANMKLKNIFIIYSLTLFLCIISCQQRSIQTGIEKDGKVYGITKGLFRHQWWNYYERGVSFMDGNFYLKAEQDFRQAIAKRDKDQIRSRTYGFHFLDYFPHRELGISLFHQQKFQDAINELEKSLSTEKSARAYYYLDKARKDLIVKNKSDKEPPQIFISSPEPEMLTNSYVINVKGHTTDDTFIKSVWINKIPFRIDVSAKSIHFNENVKIIPGENHIEIKALDIVGKFTAQKKKVICDIAGPVLNINDIISTHDLNTYILDGYAYDNAGIKEIRINDENIIKNLLYTKSWKHKFTSFENHIKVIATDKVGNRTIARLQLPSAQQSNLSILFNKPLIASMAHFPILSKLDHRKSLKKNNSRLIMAFNERGGSAIEHSKKQMSCFGNYYALIIGINAYKHWTPLKTAINDAAEFKNILIQKYAVEESNVKLLLDKDATLKNTVHIIRKMAGYLDEQDNFLIYFAGHGKLDDLTSDGYWIPVDGLRDDPCTWMTHSSIKSILSSEKVRGKNIMVIADSCYSGNLLRGDNIQLDTSSRNYEQRLIQLAQKKSRQIIASGGMEQVADWGRDNHSLFAYYLIQSLKDNEQPFIDLENLVLTKVWKNVSEKGGQRPTIGRLKTAMDEDGQFLLVLKNKFTHDMNSKKASIPQNYKVSYPSRSSSLPDTIPPEIEIKGWKEERIVFLERVYIEGSAFDREGGIQQLLINEQKIINRPTKQLYFNTLVSLKPGLNSFKFICVDHVGNKKEKEILIHRKNQKVFENGSRMSIILFPFELKAPYNISMYDMILSKLLDSGRFHIIRVSRDNIINQKYSDNTADSKALQTARKYKADIFITPEVNMNDKSLDIWLWAVESNTNEYISRVNVYGEQINKQLIETLAEGLYVQILDEFPLIKGKLIKCKGNELVTNLGENYNIKKGMQVIFYQEDEPFIDPDTGENLGSDVIELAAARINKVLSKISYAEILNKKENILLSRGLELITK